MDLFERNNTPIGNCLYIHLQLTTEQELLIAVAGNQRGEINQQVKYNIHKLFYRCYLHQAFCHLTTIESFNIYFSKKNLDVEKRILASDIVQQIH